jgi:hypothetical protein
VCRVRSDARIRSAVSNPLRPGMRTSSKTTAKSRSASSRRASSPEQARRRFSPNPSKTASSARRFSGRSSTKRMSTAAGREAVSSGMRRVAFFRARSGRNDPVCRLRACRSQAHPVSLTPRDHTCICLVIVRNEQVINAIAEAAHFVLLLALSKRIRICRHQPTMRHKPPAFSPPASPD